MANVKFTINCEMEERWVSHFLSMLKTMESLGNLGSSRLVAFYADGDGDFRPKFDTDRTFTFIDGREIKDPGPIEYFFDAG